MWRPVYLGTATGYGAGAASNTWHEITAVDFNALNYTYGSVRVYLSFANGNPTYGYTGIVMCDVPNAGANVTYAGAAMGGTDPSGTTGTEVLTQYSCHTGTSGLTWHMKFELDGSNYKRLYVKSNVVQTTNTALFGVPQLYVLVNGWIDD